MTQFAGALRAQLNLQPDTENTQSVPSSATSELLSKAVSSLDISGAEYGTFLLKDKLHDQAIAYSIITVKQQHLSSLNTNPKCPRSLTNWLLTVLIQKRMQFSRGVADREDNYLVLLAYFT